MIDEPKKAISPAILYSMPVDSLDPDTEETVSYVRKTCNSERQVLYPKDGNYIVVMYMEMSAENSGAVGDAISVIEANCEESKLFKGWTVSSEAGKRAAVQVRAQVHNDIPLGE